MSETYAYPGAGAASPDQTRTLFGQTMWYVAATTGMFALGAYAGRHLSGGWAIISYIAAFACLIAMNFSVRRSRGLDSAPLIAASIFLDALNVFLFFLRIFSSSEN